MEHQNCVRYTRARRRQMLDVDLNVPPPFEIRDEDVVPNSEMQAAQVGGSTLPPPIDVDEEVLDDDIMISSPRAFEEASKNARRNRRRPAPGVVDVDSGPSRNRRRRTTPFQTIINCETYINLEGESNSTGKVVPSAVAPPPPPAPPSPPKAPVFSCPVCMSQLVEETSTKCGHIFCKQCIKAAIAAQTKCPTCRKRTTNKDIFRIYLPATQSA
ncbi:hypothetical protein ACS0TY_006580 [Phlomoides rotata]